MMGEREQSLQPLARYVRNLKPLPGNCPQKPDSS